MILEAVNGVPGMLGRPDRARPCATGPQAILGAEARDGCDGVLGDEP